MATFQEAPVGIQVSGRSDALSDPLPSATSNHAVAFTVNNAISGSSTLTLTFPTGFVVPTTLDCGDIDAATSSQFNFNYPGCNQTATAWGFSATGYMITLQAPADAAVHVATGTAITINIGSNATVGQQGSHWLTNPSAAGVYTISVGGTFGGSGNMLVSINSGVTVQATVAESLAFTVSSVKAVYCTADDGATVAAIDTSPTTVAFGTVSLNTFSQGCQDLIVSTNAGNGYSVTVQESSAMKTANGQFTIPDTTCDAGDCTVATATTWVTPTKNGFGHTCLNISGSDCNPTYGSGKKFKPVSSIPTGTAPGQISFVQTTENGAFGSGSSTTTPAFTNAQTAGDLIVVTFFWDNNGSASALSVTDTAGNVYVAAGPVQAGAGGVAGYSGQVWYAKSIRSAGAGSNQVTCKLTGANGSFFQCTAIEYSGADASGPLDATHSANGTSSSPDSGPAQTNYANELVLGSILCSSYCGHTPGSGFTERSALGGDEIEDKSVTSTGSYHATSSDPAEDYLAIVTTFVASNTPRQIMSNTGASTATGRVKYRLSVPSSQTAGTYTTVITYTIYATY